MLVFLNLNCHMSMMELMLELMYVDENKKIWTIFCIKLNQTLTLQNEKTSKRIVLFLM